MIRRHRRIWAPAAGLLLALPLIFSLAKRDIGAMSVEEKRDLAPPPAWPGNLGDWLVIPGQTEAYLNDHFGLRSAAIRIHAVLTHRLLHTGNELVMFGRDGWMFYLNDDMVKQSAGMIRRDQQVAEAADLLVTINTTLAASGARLLVAVPPNSATIYADQLPIWARNPGRTTEYDVFLDDLAARGVPAVDLRPALREARTLGKVYHLHDTHWTVRGALAGFNALVQADGHPDWTVDAHDVLEDTDQNLVGGDLAVMLGIGADVTETDSTERDYATTSRQMLDPERGSYTATSGIQGPTIMVIGDSFTKWQFTPFILRHASRVVFIRHQLCGFEWKWIEQFHPDEVWYMPTERLVLCPPD